MAAVIPRRLLAGVASEDVLLASYQHDRAVRLLRRRRRREIPLGVFPLDDAGLRAAARVLRRKSPHVVVITQQDDLLEREVMLPLAVERDIDNVLTYEMDRLTPFSADEIFWRCDVARRDRAAAQLLARLSVVPKRNVQPLMAALAQLGLTADAIELCQADGSMRRIPCRTRRMSPLRRRLVASIACAAAVFGIAIVVTPFVRQSVARGRIEQRIASLQPRVTEVEALRRRIASRSAEGDAMASDRARAGDVLRVLALVTDILPDNTVLSDLSLNQGKLGLSGQSGAAAQLIPLLAADHTIQNPSFAAPVTRSQDGQADSFAIRAELAP